MFNHWLKKSGRSTLCRVAVFRKMVNRRVRHVSCPTRVSESVQHSLWDSLPSIAVIGGQVRQARDLASVFFLSFCFSIFGRDAGVFGRDAGVLVCTCGVEP